jgi:hypothetical protein
MTAEGQRAGRKRREVLTHQVYRCQDRSSSLVNRSRGSVPSSNYCKRAACQNNLVKSEFPKTIRTRRVEKISPLDSRESLHVRNQKLSKYPDSLPCILTIPVCHISITHVSSCNQLWRRSMWFSNLRILLRETDRNLTFEQLKIKSNGYCEFSARLQTL